mmetsp:Transcript_34422/g.75350  ORF Transcript_34422/g.75350 Transcript_34422/m.75350 type:complete len:564 (-) Transcript_34422:1057-2748(-)
MLSKRKHITVLLASIVTIILATSVGQAAAAAAATSNVRASDNNEKTQYKQPNIILLLTDDQDVLLGGIDRMPSLRQYLIDRGTTFTNAYVHTPICCPSRSSILSGRYLHNGVTKNNSVSGNCNGQEWRDDAERKTFAVYAQEAGYVTSYAGKYLNAYGCQKSNVAECKRVPPGWDKWFGLVGNSRYYNATIVNSDDGGTTSRLLKHGDDYEKDYLPDALCNRTLDMIREFTREEEKKKPFLIVNAWPTPHGPFTPAPWAEHAFDGVKAPRTANWNASSNAMQQKHWMLRQLLPIDNITESLIDTTYQHRLEALLSVDDHIGQIARLLEAKGELDNTIIIYTSDHGFQLGQHRLAVDKRHLYEHDIKVPFIAFSGRSAEKRTSNEIVLNIDIAPTIYELSTGSSDIPESMDGSSFAALLNGGGGGSRNRRTSTSRIRDDFLISYHGEGYAPCGMAECPPNPHGGWMPDAWNNTYHCVRTVTSESTDGHVDSIFCLFEDNENFVEYYDLTVDPRQLSNKYNELSPEEIDMYKDRLAQLRSCHGSSCRARVRLDNTREQDVSRISA